MDVIVSHIEVNHLHGVGVLLRRLFGASPNIVSIRSRDCFEGVQDFGEKHFCIAHGDQSRPAVIERVHAAIGDCEIDRILCVPYFSDDVLNALALREISGAPLCAYLMDDQNLYDDGIPDELIAELFDKSALRLAISQELRDAYQLKFGRALEFMPPLAPAQCIPKKFVKRHPSATRGGEALMVGNVWGIHWMQSLRAALRGSGVTVRWINRGNFSFWANETEALARDGIILHDAPESDESLVEMLRHAAFVVVPTGALDAADDRPWIARLSLPSRVPFILATAQTPILVLGSPETAVSRFVRSARIGVTCPYDRKTLRNAAARLRDARVNRKLRRSAFQLAKSYSDCGAAEWIWRSLANRGRIDDRYEQLAQAR